MNGVGIQPSITSSANQPAFSEWWKGAVIYQVYPRSYLDTSGNGIGDLKGIVEKLDYIADLGVDAVWVSPFFMSPMKDFGYDVSDFRAVDPLFGSLSDFDQMIAKAHSLGLKVMIDQVLSHTSDQHSWFQESRSSRDNDKADWYVWADAKEDGSEPNNWLAIFGGSAWQWDETREQYFLHNFLTSQPDLNFHNPEMRKQLLKEVAFWLDRGVDGLRLDAINFCFHDAQLRDNPLKPIEKRKGRGFSPDNPYAAQYHLYDNTQPENLVFLEELRALLDSYPDRVTLGEINSEDSLATTVEYTTGGKRLNMGYSFELLADEFSADYVQETAERLNKELSEGWACWALSNHDVTRVVTRWGKQADRKAFSKFALALSASLKGTICLYQGEELGLPEADIERHQMMDPFGIRFWPNFKGRDGCRTPMPWSEDEQNCGFSQSQPWLPIPESHLALNVQQQAADKSSTLNFAKAFYQWRKSCPSLLYGDMKFWQSAPDTLIIERTFDQQTVLCCFNFIDKPVAMEIPVAAKPVQTGFTASGLEIENGKLELPSYGFSFLELE